MILPRRSRAAMILPRRSRAAMILPRRSRAARILPRRSLLRQLVVGVSAVVSAVVMAVGAVAVLSLRGEVVTMADSQVSHSLSALGYWYANSGRPTPGGGSVAAGYPGQAPGTVVAVLSGDSPIFTVVINDDGPAGAPAEVARALASVAVRDGATTTVTLGDLGAHRVGSRDLGGGRRLVSAVSMEEANRTLAWNTALIGGLVVLALLATAAGTVIVVRHALRPLRRVAAVAGNVAMVPLQAGQYRITERVAVEDTDPETEVGVVGHTLNQMLDNVDSALTSMAETDRHMRQFLTDASHELRTPLAAILGYAELTRQESDVLPPMTEYALTRIEAESRRMSDLVADLLLLSRLDERQDLDVEDVDLCDVVADAVNDAAVTATGHRFVAELPDRAVEVRGDRARLVQLVANLLANAGLHTPPGVTVVAAVAATTDGVELTVTDDGPGIPPEIMPNLFGRFVRADRARSREMGSSGLGLAIVASIVEAHGGTVSAESVPGRTVFTVCLPAGEAER